MTRILFILKKRPPGPYDSWSFSPDGQPKPSGLTVSVAMLAKGLERLGIEHKIVQVHDNNDIDREVHAYKPTHVIVEAFWVVPSKFDQLLPLHPTVHWIVRNHSKSDFLSHEGGMVGWAIEYVKKGITLACNSPEAVTDFRKLARSSGVDGADADRLVVYLPNYYEVPRPDRPIRTILWSLLRFIGIYGRQPTTKSSGVWQVGCYGAIRPLKNHLHQAIAAISVANELGLKLRFHVNATRVEGRGEPLLKSLQVLFKQNPQHELVEAQWLNHDDFLREVARLDLLTQVSRSETFNIVAADTISQHVPVLGSSEIPFLLDEAEAGPSVPEIEEGLHRVWRRSGNGYFQRAQQWVLHNYGDDALLEWRAFFS
jgi:hypothetical protein